MPSLRPLLGILVLAAAPLSAGAQGRFPPETLRNLTVLPATTTVPQVVAMMRGFTTALGVRCTHCHVGEEGKPLTTYDFASDEKPAKGAARVMMQMAGVINREQLPKLAARGTPALQVTCETCHRGVARPVPIEVIVEGALQHGADSASRAYRGLLARYRDRGAYDFSENPLLSIAQRLAPSGRLDDALAVTALNDEVHPTSAFVPALQGELYLLKRDTVAAIAAFQKALSRDPMSPARVRLQQLGRTP